MRIPNINVIYRCLKGELYKYMFKSKLFRIHKDPLNKKDLRKQKLIVSLTSYGRRVSEVAPYAIMSIMKQTLKPDLIVLWLDKEEWNDSILPKNIKRLRDNGLTIMYCKNYKSYKKLIPAINEFPNDLIFTIDDDLYYPPNILEQVMKAHLVNKTRIIGVRGYIPVINNGTIEPYNEWNQIKRHLVGKGFIITGGAGCLYQRRLLYDDISNWDLIRNLAPNADDLWFSFMIFLKKTTIEVLSFSKKDTIPIDSFYQRFHKGSNLSEFNIGDSQNDAQLSAIMSHYNITCENISSALRNNVI